MSANLVTTKELAKLLGVSIASVNYYTNLGFFNIRERKGNTRLYDKNEIITTYRRMGELRKEGYSLRLIQQRLKKGYNI